MDVVDVVEFPPPLDEPVDPEPPEESAADRGVTDADAAELDDEPPAFTATAVNVYDVPFVRPDTTQLVAGTVTVHDSPPGDAVTTYDSGAPPPDGAVTVTVA